MRLDPIAPDLFRFAGFANMYLLEAPEGLTLVDAGLPNSTDKILKGLRERGHAPADLKHIALTHAHPDHIGSLAALVRATGARTYMHPADIPVAETGGPFRPFRDPSPELLGGLMFKLLGGRSMTVEPVRIDQPIANGDVLPLAGGLQVIGTPGHCAGQVALLWPARGVLFTGDACMNLFGLGGPIAYEDLAEGERSQRKLAAVDFSIACFGHGRPIRQAAAEHFRRRWG